MYYNMYMDDYDDVDELDEDSEFEDSEDFDEELDEDFDKDFDVDSERDLGDLEDLGVMDGQQDAISGSCYTGFGMSVDDFDSLSDEERDAYESGYLDGFNAGGGWG